MMHNAEPVNLEVITNKQLNLLSHGLTPIPTYSYNMDTKTILF